MRRREEGKNKEEEEEEEEKKNLEKEREIPRREIFSHPKSTKGNERTNKKKEDSKEKQ